MKDGAGTIAERQEGLITRRQALKAGLSVKAIKLRLADGRWEAVHRGVYRLVGTQPSHLPQVRAACLWVGQEAVASHGTAARIHGLPLAPADIHVTVANCRCPEIADVKIHRVAPLDGPDWVYKKAIPVTTVARTIIDLAGELSKERLEEVLDHAVAEKLVHLKELKRRLKALGTQGPLAGEGLTPRLAELRSLSKKRARTASPSRYRRSSLGLSPQVPGSSGRGQWPASGGRHHRPDY